MNFFVRPQSAILNDYDQSEQVDTGLMKKMDELQCIFSDFTKRILAF